MRRSFKQSNGKFIIERQYSRLIKKSYNEATRKITIEDRRLIKTIVFEWLIRGNNLFGYRSGAPHTWYPSFIRGVSHHFSFTLYWA